VKRGIALAAGVASVAVSALVAFLALRGLPGEEAGPAPRPSAGPPAPRRDASPATAPGALGERPLDAFVARSRDEFLLLVREPGTGLVVRDLQVWCVAPSGDPEIDLVSRAGATDDSGFLRARIDPPSADRLSLREAAEEPGTGQAVPGGFLLEVRLPPAAAAPAEIEADRDFLRPGDDLRVSVLERDGTPTTIALRPEDPGIPEVALEPEGEDPPLPGRRILRAEIPGDARPGSVVIVHGSARLELPLRPRFGPEPGPASPSGPGAAESPGAAAAPGDLLLESRDGAWQATPPLDAPVVLFWAEARGEILVHQVVLVKAGEAAATLPLGAGPGPVRVRAVAATSRGFVEGSATAARPPGPSRDAGAGDPDLRAFRSSRPPEPAPGRAPGWVYPADEPAGTPAPERRPFVFEVRSLLVPGEPGTFGQDDVPVPDVATVRWTAAAAPSRGSFRLRADGAIVLEGAVGPASSEGTIPCRRVRGKALLVESNAEGFPGLVLRAAVPADPARIRAAGPVAILRDLPASGTVGGTVRVGLSVDGGAGDSRVVAVRCPLPRCAVPAEDLWSLRERAPEGTRVAFDGETLSWVLPRLPPERTDLSFRIRLRIAGRFGAPPASVDRLDGGAAVGNSAGGEIRVE
jgi:hypothetical protein